MLAMNTFLDRRTISEGLRVRAERLAELAVEPPPSLAAADHPWPPPGAAGRPDLQRFVRQAFRQRPAQARAPRPPDAFPSGRRAHPEAGGNLRWTCRRPTASARRGSCAWVISLQACPAPSWKRSEAMPIRGSPNGARYPRPQAGRDRPEWLVAINRNAWSQSIGTPGRNHPVCAPHVRSRAGATIWRRRRRPTSTPSWRP